jgi:molybdate transport system substrate-binding protein
MKDWSGSAVFLAVAAILASLAVACGDDAGTDPTPAAQSAPALSGKITVFAAASLTDSFSEIKATFIKQNPGTEIDYQFAGSPVLRAQLEQGARADVYASADIANMTQALNAGLVANAGKVFVKNSLVIITPRNNPARLAAPADLKRSGLKLVLAAPEVPVGNYARQAFALMEKDANPAFGAGFADAVLKNLVSNESNVKQVVAKVQLGEADAGVVYGTDVSRDVVNDLMQIAIPTNLNVIAEYPIARTRSPANARLAEAFIAFVMGPDGQAILKKYGFQTVS